MFLLLYVDDVILTSSDKAFTTSIIQLLRSAFDLKDLGLLHYFLGYRLSILLQGCLCIKPSMLLIC